MSFFTKYKKILTSILAVVVLLSAVGLAFYSGYESGTTKPRTITIKGVSNMDSSFTPTADFGIFWEAWQKLKDEHIKGLEIKDQDLIYGAVNGMVNSLNDPYTIFLKPDDSKKFEEDVSGSFGGVGMEIGVKNDQLIVVAPIKDSPAAKAGILAGDKILEVDHKSTYGLNTYDAVKKIRGEIGTKVVITILHDGEDKPKEIEIVRARIEVPTLNTEVKDGNIAYLQLASFNENAPFLFYKAALEILVNNSKGIILDLRNDPGGYLDVAVKLAGWFLEKDKVVVTEKFRDGKEIVLHADGNAALKDIPVVILINKGSASASEILAGALQYHRKIKLIGEASYGKGTVQELQKLKDGSEIKITIAQWLLPDGKVLEGNGLTPNIEVELTEKDVEAKKDPQLDRALEEIKKLIQ